MLILGIDPGLAISGYGILKYSGNKFEVIESSSYTREYNRDPSFIKLLPNTQYIVAHTGMGAKVNIFKYYYTDPFGKLHANDSLNEHINVDSIRIRLNR